MPTSDNSLPPNGPTLRRAFEALVSTLNERGVRYAIVGGLATIQYTRVRATDDIDVLLTVPRLALPGLFEALQERGFAIDLVRNIREFCDNGLTSVRFADVIVDLMQPMIPAYGHILDRAISTEMLGRQVRVSSAEGLMVMKLMAMRPQDEADIQELLTAYGPTLDMDYIWAELETFAEPDDARRAKLDSWIRQAGVQD